MNLISVESVTRLLAAMSASIASYNRIADDERAAILDALKIVADDVQHLPCVPATREQSEAISAWESK